jgi:predicted patatin/cPLA2 family phospholipase
MYDLIMKIALVLQGGGSRGIFTTAILDSLLDLGINIDKIFAVSAGGLNAMNFLSKQKGRAKKATLLTFKSKEFKSISNVIRKHSFVDFDYYFNQLEKELPFDYKTFNNNHIQLCVVATSLNTGTATYFNKNSLNNFNEAIKASASLPFVAKPVEINGELYLDGGDSDPVPFKKALDEGYDKVIVITTRPKGFRKDPEISNYKKRLIRFAFKKYPKFMDALENSHKNYNKCIDELESPNSKVFLIQPSEDIKLKHLETNEKKLDYYYNLGTKIFEENKEKLVKFLN